MGKLTSIMQGNLWEENSIHENVARENVGLTFEVVGEGFKLKGGLT